MLGITREIQKMISGCFHRKVKGKGGGSDISQTTELPQKERDQASTLVDDINEMITYPDYFLEKGKERVFEQALFNQALRSISDAFKFGCSVEGEIFFDYVFRNNHDENLLAKIDGMLNGDIKSFTLNAEELLSLNNILYGIHKSYRVKVEGDIVPRINDFLECKINEVLNKLDLSLFGEYRREVSPFCLSRNKDNRYYETFPFYYDLLHIRHDASLCRYLINLYQKDLDVEYKFVRESVYRFEISEINGKREYESIIELNLVLNEFAYHLKKVYQLLTLVNNPLLLKVMKTKQKKEKQRECVKLLDTVIAELNKAYDEALTFLEHDDVGPFNSKKDIYRLIKDALKRTIQPTADIVTLYRDNIYFKMISENEVTLSESGLTRIYIETLIRLRKQYLILEEFQNKIITKLEEYEKTKG